MDKETESLVQVALEKVLSGTATQEDISIVEKYIAMVDQTIETLGELVVGEQAPSAV